MKQMGKQLEMQLKMYKQRIFVSKFESKIATNFSFDSIGTRGKCAHFTYANCFESLSLCLPIVITP